jgi:hypothetical protein
MKLNYSIFLTSVFVLNTSRVSTSVNIQCVDILTSNAFEQIKSNNLIFDDNCKNNLSPDKTGIPMTFDDKGNNKKSLVDDNGIHQNGTVDDNGIHQNGTLDDNGIHQNGTVDDNGIHQNGTVDDNGNQTGPIGSVVSNTCSLVVLSLCDKVRSEHNDVCGIITDDDCFGIIRNVSTIGDSNIPNNSGVNMYKSSFGIMVSYLFFVCLV